MSATMHDTGSGVKDSALPSSETASAKRIRLFKQILIILAICLTFMVFAASIGWTNPAVSDINKDNTNIYGTNITLEPWETDMIGSLVYAGMIPGAWMGGWMGTSIGRRYSLMLLQVPAILGWLLITFAYNSPMILVGRVLHGINKGAGEVVANSLVVEVSDSAYRGAFTSLTGLSMSIAALMTLSFGFVLRWFELSYFGIALGIAAGVSVFFLPESPTYLALSGKEQEARRTLARLRGPAADLEMEMEVIRQMNENGSKGSLFATLMKTGLWRSVVVICVLMFLQNFCGFIVVANFTTRIFIEAGISIDEKVAALLAIFVLMVGCSISAICVDKIGRRWLLVISTSLITVFSLLIGIYYYLDNKNIEVQVSVAFEGLNTTYNETIGKTNYTTKGNQGLIRPIDDSWWWVPVVCVMGITFSGGLGIGPVPWLLSAEYFPTSLRPMCIGITSTLVSIWSFASLQLYSPLLSALTTAGLFWFYGGISALGVVFCLTCVSETRNVAIG